MSQISWVVYHRISQSRGMKGASKPIRPPPVKALRKDFRFGHKGENGLCSEREEMLHLACWRYL